MVNPWLITGPAVAAAAGGVIAYGAAYPRAQLFGPTVRYTASLRQLAITFDDGPNPAITPQLLELLARYDARATFFLIGRFVRQFQDLVREIAARGHAIGNHTETHPNLFWLGRERLHEELGRCQEALAALLGAPPAMMRPPFGFRSPLLNGVAREAGLRSVVMWTLLPGDWWPQPSERLIRRMQPIARRAERARQGMPHRSSGDILCLHDGDYHRPEGDRRHTLVALEYWLPRWRDLGLEFVTIPSAAGEGPH